MDEIKCEDCPKVAHAETITELKSEMKNFKKGLLKYVLAICAVLLTGIGIAETSYHRAAVINQQTASSALEIHKQQAEYKDEILEYKEEISESVKTVRDFRGTLDNMETEWYSRKQNEDFIMKQLYEINSKLEKRK